jgi:outer membrane protein TolC
LSLAANVTQAWLLLVEANTQQQLAQKSAELADKWAALAQTRQQIGAENGSYVAQAKSLAASYHQQVASIEQAKRAATQALERLIGRYPATQLQVTTILPKLPELPNAGFPLGLLERRPDVISAERRVAEAFDRVASAQAARLPRLSLTGTGSNFVSKVFELQNSGVTQWGLGGTVLVPIFQGGALLAQVDVQKANQKAALAFYASTALNAFTDVERALSNEKGLTQQAKQQAVQLESAGKQLQYAQSRTAIGKDSQIGLLQQQLAWYAEKATSVRLQSAQLTQRVSTHLAIGGSFSNKNYPELELEGDASAPVSK